MPLPTFFRRLRARLKYRNFDQDLRQELESHRAMTEDNLRARGVNEADARSAASRALGNTTYMREEARAVWFARWIEHLWQDLRYAGRRFRHQPGFAMTGVLTLGLALGLVTSVFAVVNGIYFRQWAVPEAGDVFLVRAVTGAGWQRGQFDLAAFQRLQRTITSADLVAMGQDVLALDNGPDIPSTR